ncbi:hypothetical protein EDC65_0759 [Stella humosa]|uniref:Thymidylate kinase n=1 Tax=Stella humosa TaxID=94 RepID=A0A3N1ME66_9PROT|nr:hypothetical protein [Stella humosa]ROQ01579.1 hypothetical protein EDC65_0759 [Stella humosa]BBK31959.1 hypothetical protein STHU_25930 [Stella humosa]
MILVVEGISASGKTTWCGQHGGGSVVPEHGRLDGVPDRGRDPAAAARFWAERNVDRWQAALAMEKGGRVAVCDTDPLKLHYVWCLWQIGEADERDWLLEHEATRDTVRDGRIGFADAYAVGRIEPQIARDRAHADATRRRRNFELHVRLQVALMRWYAAIDQIMPGRVQFGLPAAMPGVRHHAERCDLGAFDRVIAALPKDRPVLRQGNG